MHDVEKHQQTCSAKVFRKGDSLTDQQACSGAFRRFPTKVPSEQAQKTMRQYKHFGWHRDASHLPTARQKERLLPAHLAYPSVLYGRTNCALQPETICAAKLQLSMSQLHPHKPAPCDRACTCTTEEIRLLVAVQHEDVYAHAWATQREKPCTQL